jgi:hypothetical protein
MTTMTALAIIVRHVEDAADSRRVCRSCGLPWPCDVRRLVDAIAAEAHLVVAAPGTTADPLGLSPHARRGATRAPIA